MENINFIKFFKFGYFNMGGWGRSKNATDTDSEIVS